MQLEQVKAVISGGASGLGFAVARRILASGGAVTLLDINRDRGRAAVAELAAEAQPALTPGFFAVDVRDEAAMSSAVGEAAAHLGGLNVAVSCAGVIGPGRALGRDGPMALEQFSTVVGINLIGTFNLCKAAAAVIAEQPAGEDGERGVLINTASIAAWEGQIGQAAYSASKGGVVGLTLPLAREFTRVGIRVMAIAPGVFHTPMIDAMPEKVQQALGAGVPFPSRLGQPREFAETVAFVIENRYMNGSTIRVDGAARLEPK